MQNTSLLIATTPHQVLPELAAKIGVNEALFLQQLHWLLINNDCHSYQGKRWYWHSEDQWLDRFPYFSKSTLKRTLTSLAKQKLIHQEKLHWQLLGIRGDTTKWYAIDYGKVAEISSEAFAESEEKKEKRWKAKREANAAKKQAALGSKNNQYTAAPRGNYGKVQNDLSGKVQNDLPTKGQNDLPYKTNKKLSSSSKPEPAQASVAEFDFDLILTWLLTQFSEEFDLTRMDKVFIKASLEEYQSTATNPGKARALAWIEQAMTNRMATERRSAQASHARDTKNGAVVANLQAQTDNITRKTRDMAPRTLAEKLADTSWAEGMDIFDDTF